MENKVKILIAENNEFGQNCVREFSSYGYNALLSDKDGAQVHASCRRSGRYQADTGDEGREKADADCSFKRG